MNNYIKNLLDTKGWKDIEKMFEDKVRECDNVNVDESMTAEEFKINVLANRKAAEKIRDLIKKIKLSAGVKATKDKISYK